MVIVIFERKKDDIFTNCYVPLSKAILGGKIQIKGLYSKVNVVVPPGSEDNSVVKLNGLGVNRKGDHYVRIKVVFPNRLKDEQINIFKNIAKYEV
jgi:DnaJ-class molecular chaperone